MSRKIHSIAIAAFLGLAALAPALAQDQLSRQDQKFLKDAAAGGMMEVQLGRLAVQKASNADVKSFGQRMVDDHGKANDRLKQVASQEGVSLPTALPPNMQNEIDKLARLSGAKFDRMYMSHMVKDHKKDVSEFEKQADRGDDASVKSFAQQTLPTLREHLQIAETLASKVGAHDHHTSSRKGGS